MNWIDLVVIAIIWYWHGLGLRKALFIQCLSWLLFHISSFIGKALSIIAKILSNSQVFHSIKKGIYHNLMLRHEALSLPFDAAAKATAQSVVDGLSLPGFMKGMIKNSLLKSLPSLTELIDVSTIMDSLSDVLAI